MFDTASVPRRSYDFEDYIDILRRNLRWILAPAFAGLVIATVVAYSKEDKYISSASIRVVPQQVSPEDRRVFDHAGHGRPDQRHGPEYSEPRHFDQYHQ